MSRVTWLGNGNISYCESHFMRTHVQGHLGLVVADPLRMSISLRDCVRAGKTSGFLSHFLGRIDGVCVGTTTGFTWFWLMIIIIANTCGAVTLCQAHVLTRNLHSDALS